MSSSPSTSTADSIFFAHSIVSCHHVICSQCVQLCAGNSIHTCDASKNAMRQNHLQPTMGCGKLVKRTEAPQRTSAPCAERNATPVRMGRTMARKTCDTTAHGWTHCLHPNSQKSSRSMSSSPSTSPSIPSTWSRSCHASSVRQRRLRAPIETSRPR